jgi:hypothetical protein
MAEQTVTNGAVRLGRLASSASTVNNTPERSKIGTYYLTNRPDIYEIQRTNNFVFQTTELAGKLGILIGDANDYAATNADEVLELSVSKSSVPHFSQGVIQVKRGNNTMKFAGTPEFKSGSLTVNDYIGSGVKDVLMAWQQKSYDVNTEKVGLAKDYKITAYLLEYTPDYQLVRTWRLEGCWISEISEDEYNHESNDKHTIQVTIEYDKAYMETNDGIAE